MIYYVGCAEAKAVKIGYTSELSWADKLGSARARLQNIQSNCPFEVELLALCDGYGDDEKALHKRFAADRIRGEWFRLSQELEDHLAQFTKPEKRARRFRGYPQHEDIVL
jgi:hypothetical protein